MSKSMKIVLLVLAISAVVIISAVVLLSFFNPNIIVAGQSQTNSKQSGTVGSPITFSGFIFCVPIRDSNNKSCVIGIQSDSAAVPYLLLDSNLQLVNPADYTTGQKRTISGYTVNGSNANQNYNVAGAIAISN